jgi:methionyl aminopeptidase
MGWHLGGLSLATCMGSGRGELQVTYECLMRAVKAVKPGMRYREIGDIISSHATRNGFSVVKTYCGHGICDLFHCAPNVPHYAKNKAKGSMQARALFAGTNQALRHHALSALDGPTVAA